MAPLWSKEEDRRLYALKEVECLPLDQIVKKLNQKFGNNRTSRAIYDRWSSRHELLLHEDTTDKDNDNDDNKDNEKEKEKDK